MLKKTKKSKSEQQPRKVIFTQIAVSQDSLYALDSDGRVWTVNDEGWLLVDSPLKLND